MQAQEDFLKKINMITVGSQKGESIYGSLSGSIMRRETSRTPVDLAQNRAYEYETVKRYFDFLITHDKRDAWIGTGQDFNQIYKRLYREQYAIDLINNAFNGTDRDTTTTDILKVDKGWGQLLEDYNSKSQVFEEATGGSGVIILGSPRKRSLHGITPTHSGGKTTIPMTAHGFIAGGQVTITEDSNHQGTFKVDDSTTVHSLVIRTTNTNTTAFSSTATITQNPDFQSIPELYSELIERIPHERTKQPELTLLQRFGRCHLSSRSIRNQHTNPK